MFKVTLGSDPELFLKNAEGKIVSAIGKIGGTKNKPRPLKDLGKGYFVQEDNVLLEYNTPIAKHPGQWEDQFKTVKAYLAEMVGQHGLQLANIASHSMPEDEMQHPRAWVFGCEPDFNVWDLKMNPSPVAADPLLRSAGGHIHVGVEDPSPANMIRLGRILDVFIGAPLAAVDKDKRRRELYGKAGAIRFKPYGLEYRTPSNYWTFDKNNILAVYYNVCSAMDFAKHGLDPDLMQNAKDFINGDTDNFDSEYVHKNFGVEGFV